MKNSYKFFRNIDCEYFPCHEGIDPEKFNCLFCYCPLYFLGEQCDGCFEFTPKKVKCCSKCPIPHQPENYGQIVDKLKDACLAPEYRLND